MAKRDPLPGNAIRATRATLARSCGRIARDEVVRVPDECGEDDARQLCRLRAATWCKVGDDFPGRGIVDGNGAVVLDTSDAGPREVREFEVERDANEARPVEQQAGTAEPVEGDGLPNVENRDPAGAERKRGAKRATG